MLRFDFSEFRYRFCRGTLSGFKLGGLGFHYGGLRLENSGMLADPLLNQDERLSTSERINRPTKSAGPRKRHVEGGPNRCTKE